MKTLSTLLRLEPNKQAHVRTLTAVAHIKAPQIKLGHTKKKLNTAYFRQGLMCTIGLANDLIDGGQPKNRP